MCFGSFLWALAKGRLSRVISYIFRFNIESIWNSHLSSKPVFNDTITLCGVRPFAQIVWIYDTTIMLSSLFYKQTFSPVGRQSNRTDNFYYDEKYIQTFFQTYLELFKCDIRLLIDCSVASNLHGEMPHTTYPKGMKYMTTCCRGKVKNVGKLYVSWLHSYVD